MDDESGKELFGWFFFVFFLFDIPDLLCSHQAEMEIPDTNMSNVMLGMSAILT